MQIRLIALLLTSGMLLFGAAAIGGETDGTDPVIMSYATPELAPELYRDKHEAVRTASFCGACTTSDACGSGWVCCSEGCSDGLKKCYNVVSCDKVADETGPLKLFALR